MIAELSKVLDNNMQTFVNRFRELGNNIDNIERNYKNKFGVTASKGFKFLHNNKHTIEVKDFKSMLGGEIKTEPCDCNECN